VESSIGTRVVADSDPHRLQIPPAMRTVVDGVTQRVPLAYSPTEAVQSTITDLFSILGNEALKQPGRFEERRQHIERIIRLRVDCKRMAQQSLGDPWTRLDDPQRREFVRLFIELIRDRVANNLDQYDDEQVFYRSEQRRGDWAEVRTALIGRKVNTALDFRLERQSGEWLVYDVVIDGASIVPNYRTQFTQIIRDASYEALVERMGQSARAVKLFEKTAPAIAQSVTRESASR
jgi:phospholipid transport system substrate-binding protein